MLVMGHREQKKKNTYKIYTKKTTKKNKKTLEQDKILKEEK